MINVILKHKDGDLELMGKFLRQNFEKPKGMTGYKWRQVSRVRLRKFFTDLQKYIKVNKGVANLDTFSGFVDGQYHKLEYDVDMWLAGFNTANKTLSIGCVFFTPSQTAKIRKWALAK
jgi:hypothetical protein